MVPRGATGWHLPLLVLAGGLLAGSLLIFFLGLDSRTTAAPSAVPATVVDTTPCGSVAGRREAGDTVQVLLDGHTERLRLDGCGNPVGTELQVELDAERSTVRLAGTEPAGNGLARRLSTLLLVLAGLAGAWLAVKLPPRQA